jgi:hypothetical protein
MSDTAIIILSIGGLLLGLGITFAYRGGKDPAQTEFDYEKMFRKQLEDQQRQAKRTDEQQDQAEEQGQRFDRLLGKWEEQAKRQDAILDHLEKEHGIKK